MDKKSFGEWFAENVVRTIKEQGKKWLPEETFPIVRGMTRGFQQGAMLRFYHAIVITALFCRHKPFRENVKKILSLTFEHGWRLAALCGAYKTMMCFLQKFSLKDPNLLLLCEKKGGETQLKSLKAWHVMLSAGLGGFLFFRNGNNSLVAQINLYVLSRVTMACCALLFPRLRAIPHVYSANVAIMNALLMYLFEFHPDLLQSSIGLSLKEIHRDPK